MTPAEGIDFVRDNHQAILATLKRDGTPQQSPVAVAVADDHIVMSTRETAYKLRNLRRDPHAWLCVFTPAWTGPWVQLSCRAEIVSLPDALEPLVDYYRSLAGEHPDWDEYRRAMVDEQRCLVRFRVDAAGPNRSG